MKEELSLCEIKEIELKILETFVKICNDNQLNYSLAYGSLLGAVRHGGFIPWDDDIDVMMPRKDFYTLLKIVETNRMPFPIISMFNVKDYFSPLAKMYDTDTLLIQNYGQTENYNTGVYIDIFIIDGLPTDNQEDFYQEASKLRKKWGYSCRNIFAKHQSRNIITDIGGSLFSIPYKLKGIKYYRDLYNNHCAQFDFYACRQAAVIVYGEGLEKEKFDTSDLINSTTVDFEGLKVKSIKNPEIYLKKMYGDYMKLPPENERISKHPNKVYKK